MPRKNAKSKQQQRRVDEQGPPQTEKNVVVNHSFMFQSATNAATTISVGDILSTMGVMCTAANTVNTMFKAFRIKQIEVWTSPVTVGVGLSNYVEWLSADSGVMTKQFGDSSNNISVPAYVKTSPPVSTAAWYWRSVTNVGGGANTDLFNIAAPTGSIIRLNVTGLISDVAFANWAITSVAAGTVAQIYYGGLDGIGAGTGLYVPIGLSTIV